MDLPKSLGKESSKESSPYEGGGRLIGSLLRIVGGRTCSGMWPGRSHSVDPSFGKLDLGEKESRERVRAMLLECK